MKNLENIVRIYRFDGFNTKRKIRIYVRKEKRLEMVKDLLVILQLDYNKEYIKWFLEKKYDLEFDDKNKAWDYVKRLVNRHIPNCIICGKGRFKSTIFTLLCKDCYSNDKRKDEEISDKSKMDFDKSLKNFIGSKFEEIKETHGDIYNIVITDFGKLGTTDFGSHKRETYRREEKTIAEEFKKLGLKPERMRS